MIRGLDRDEAFAVVQPLIEERTTTVRSNGIRKILSGTIMVLAPKSEPGDIAEQ